MSVKNPKTPGGDLATQEHIRIAKPRNHKVLLHNDDFTTQQFVVDVLVRIFRKTQTDATQIMLTVHHTGMGVAGIYAAEVAEAKVSQTTEYARAHNFPLKCTMEPE
jgi:ATP-dependent Clp protease adaptor protein ClpS